MPLFNKTPIFNLKPLEYIKYSISENTVFIILKKIILVWLDPTDALKVPYLFEALGEWPLKNVDVFSPNFNELRAFSVCFSQKIEGTEALECSQFVSQVEG